MPSGRRQVTTDRGGRQGAHVVEMQRQRLLTAVVELVGEASVQAVTVGRVCERAGISRKTFYDLFADREACLLASFEQALVQAADVVVPAFEGPSRWCACIRGGLIALLSFLDDRPDLARLLFIEALSGGPRVLQRRAQVIDKLVVAVDGGTVEAKGRGVSQPLTAEGVVGAVFAVLHTRLLEATFDGYQRPLIELASQLMGVIVYPYLGKAAAQKEIDTHVPAPSLDDHLRRRVAKDPFKDLPMRLTYRTARVLYSIEDRPGASNKQIASAAGVSDQGQMSRLLTRLEGFGLICNAGAGPAKGEAKAWALTDKGHGVLQAVGLVYK